MGIKSIAGMGIIAIMVQQADVFFLIVLVGQLSRSTDQVRAHNRAVPSRS